MSPRVDGDRPDESSSAEELVRWTQRRFGSRAAFACSFGAEDMVLLHLIAQAGGADADRIRVFTLDTGRLFSETYDLLERARAKYGIPIEVVFPDTNEVERMVTAKGPNLFYESVENRKLCCTVRKVHPLERVLAGSDAWIVGLRREQSTDRSFTPKVGDDPSRPGVTKVSPLADWSWDDVMRYVRAHDVPISALHARGFASVGCAPCSRAVQPGSDPRSGRWWWETGAKECGLHPEGAPHVTQDLPATAPIPSATVRAAVGARPRLFGMLDLPFLDTIA